MVLSCSTTEGFPYQDIPQKVSYIESFHHPVGEYPARRSNVLVIRYSRHDLLLPARLPALEMPPSSWPPDPDALVSRLN